MPFINYFVDIFNIFLIVGTYAVFLCLLPVFFKDILKLGFMLFKSGCITKFTPESGLPG